MPFRQDLASLATLIRSFILTSTTAAGSGHPTSSLSAVELMTVLFFNDVFRADLDDPKNPANDRLIFSKGHAAPLFYALYAAAGKVTPEELLTIRKFDSPLEGHPTMRFPYTEAATGSLGQGLSIGVGMALNAKYLDKFPYNTYVLLGDSEMAEGSVWEAIASAAHYKLDNLVGIIDVNRLGQRGETMYGHDVTAFAERINAFGWETITLPDGHDLQAVADAYDKVATITDRPTMIIARTLKGAGVSFLADQDNWHGKPVPKDRLDEALAELGHIDSSLRGTVATPSPAHAPSPAPTTTKPIPAYKKPTATRKAYGNALGRLAAVNPQLVVLDAETSNSTFAEVAKKEHDDRFFEMYIAEQHMVGTALGLAARGKVPFVSSFAAFLTRACDQIRMLQYSDANVKIVGSHAGVSIGEDGSSQMGVEDIALFRTLLNANVLYPADAIAAEKLVEAAAEHHGVVYIRTTRMDTPVIYDSTTTFPLGGCKVVKESASDVVTVVGAGVTLFEALKAYDALQKDGISIRVIDLYSVKPIDTVTLAQAAKATKAIITVEDHYPEGGIGEAVCSALSTVPTPVHTLAVRKMSRSGTPTELLAFEEIDAAAIEKKVREVVGGLPL